MTLRDEFRTFFILYNNGETFYFSVDSNSKIYCNRLKNVYEYYRKDKMPGADILEFTGNSFCLKSETGEKIYSLEDYYNEIKDVLPMPTELPEVEMLYIDEDVRTHLLSEGIIKYDEKASNIVGLLNAEKEEPVKGFARVKRP